MNEIVEFLIVNYDVLVLKVSEIKHVIVYVSANKRFI